MAARKSFLLRVDPAVWAAVEAWAAHDLRSTNAQVEFLLRDALRRAGRLPRHEAAPPARATRPEAGVAAADPADPVSDPADVDRDDDTATG